MVGERRQTFFIIADPSAMFYYSHLQDLMKLLEDLEQRHINFEVLLPQILHSSLDYFERGLQEEETDTLAEIYKEWLSPESESIDEAKNKLMDLGRNEDYKSLIRELRDRYSPKNAEIYAYRDIDPDDQRIINRLFTREELNQKLGQKRNVATVLYEMLSVSAKFGGAIVGFARRFAKGTWGILKSIGKPIIEARSRLKEEIKNRQHIQSALKFCIVVASYAAASAIYSQLGPMIPDLVLIPLADHLDLDRPPGVSAAIQRGLTFLIVNG